VLYDSQDTHPSAVFFVHTSIGRALSCIVLHLMGVYYPSRVSLPVMVMELMDESLTKYVEKSNINLKGKISILHDVAEGLTYLHTRNPPVLVIWLRDFLCYLNCSEFW